MTDIVFEHTPSASANHENAAVTGVGVVTIVSADGPAAHAGIVVGDKITAIQGHMIAELTSDIVRGLLVPGAIGAGDAQAHACAWDHRESERSETVGQRERFVRETITQTKTMRGSSSWWIPRPRSRHRGAAVQR